MLCTMKEILTEASKGNYAVAAPNVYTELDARACIEAAEALNAPLILDVGFNTHPDIFFFGQMLRQLALNTAIPVAINLDHGAEKDTILKAMQAGFTSVMVDRSTLPIEQNIAEVKELTEIAHLIGISVEAELGHVGQAAQYEEDRRAGLTQVEDAVRYIEETGVDCLAVAIGTAHGAYPKGFKPYLDFERLEEIKQAVGDFPLVLHGSSGTDHEDIRKACTMGINKVNIANDMCRAVMEGIIDANLGPQGAYKVYLTGRNAAKAKLMEMIPIYGSVDKAWQQQNLRKEVVVGSMEEYEK